MHNAIAQIDLSMRNTIQGYADSVFLIQTIVPELRTRTFEITAYADVEMILADDEDIDTAESILAEWENYAFRHGFHAYTEDGWFYVSRVQSD